MVYRAVIPPAYEDRNGHMNMRWYLALYDEAGDAMYPMLGLTADYFAASGMGGFDLEHHLWYPAEVRIGDTVVIRVRIIAQSAKLMHYLFFMVNETRGVVSSIFECVHAHADLTARRTAPFPAQVAAQIDAFIAAHRAWPGPRRSRGPWAYSLLPRGREYRVSYLRRASIQLPCNHHTMSRLSNAHRRTVPMKGRTVPMKEGWAFHSFELRHADQNQHNPKTSRVIPA